MPAFVILFSLASANASEFHVARKEAVLAAWQKDMKTPGPTDEVLLATRYFIRDVIAGNQELVMTNAGSYWNKVRDDYGGKRAPLESDPLKNLYDFNWYVFHELKAWHDKKSGDLGALLSDYLEVVDLFCASIPDSVIIGNFFETYFTDWMVGVATDREFLARMKPIIAKGVTDLPAGMQGFSVEMNSLEEALKEPVKNRAVIDSILQSANNGCLKGAGCCLTFHLFKGEQASALVNAYHIDDESRYSVKTGTNNTEMDVLKLRRMDNLNLGVGASGYYFKKRVYIFTDNQPYVRSAFNAFFRGAKEFPFFERFVNEAGIKSAFKNGAIKRPVFDELTAFHSWLNSGEGKTFVKEVKTLSQPPAAAAYDEWLGSMDNSILLREALGRGGMVCNGTLKEPALPAFENGVDAEFYAYLLEFIYSPIQGFNLACMFSDMANPMTFPDRHGDAYLKICAGLAGAIEKNQSLSERFNARAKAGDRITVSGLAGNLRKFEKYNCKARVKGCLLPLVSFLNELGREERTALLLSVYSGSTDKPVPEPGK